MLQLKEQLTKLGFKKRDITGKPLFNIWYRKDVVVMQSTIAGATRITFNYLNHGTIVHTTTFDTDCSDLQTVLNNLDRRKHKDEKANK